MSLHIDDDRRMRALIPPEVSEQEQRPQRTVQGVMVFTGATAAASIGLFSAGFSLHDWRLALVASTLAVMSTIAASVLVCHHLLADRMAFYHLGELYGWMRGWRGQPPESGNPMWRN